MKRIIWGDYIDAYLERNSEENIIHQEIEAAAEEGILSEQELEQVQEEMLDELYQKMTESDDKNRRTQAYLIIAKRLHDAMEEQRLKYEELRKAYIDWTIKCAERGIF